MNEEPQVYVHDLYICVTVHLLEGTPAVLSLGKLCKEHSCTSEWPSGSEPRLTKKKKESDLVQNRELHPTGISRSIIEFYHNFFLDIAPARSIYFFESSKCAK